MSLSTMVFATDKATTDKVDHYQYTIKIMEKDKIITSVDMTTILKEPSPMQIKKFIGASDCVWTHNSGSSNSELTMKNYVDEGVSVNILAIENKNDTIKTLINISQYTSVEESKLIVINDNCMIQSENAKTLTFRSVMDLKLNTPTKTELANGNVLLITVDKL